MCSPATIQPATAVVRHRVDPRLLRAIATSLATLGNIELPDAAPSPDDARNLKAMAGLYLAAELERAQVLSTAELIAGLFASGSIGQPLGPSANLLAGFWRRRRERLSADERRHLFQQVFEPQAFDPLMYRLCDALAGQIPGPSAQSDIAGRIVLREAAEALAAWLAPRAVGMAQFAAQEIVSNLSDATHFMRDRLLQLAFGAHDLWGLVEMVGRTRGQGLAQVRLHADLGRDGAAVLAWLADGRYWLETDSPAGQNLMMAAEGWRSGWRQLHAIAPVQSGP